MKAMMVPATMSFFNLLQFLALFVCKISSHLSVRVSDRFVNAPGRVSPNFPELYGCLIDDGRNLGDLFWRQLELGA